MRKLTHLNCLLNSSWVLMISGLEFNGNYRKIPGLDFSTEFQGPASKIWVSMKVTEPKENGSILNSMKYYWAFVLCLPLLTRFSIYFLRNSHWPFYEGVLIPIYVIRNWSQRVEMLVQRQYSCLGQNHAPDSRVRGPAITWNPYLVTSSFLIL